MDARVRAWRHDLHRIPEIAFNECETGRYIAAVLAGLGFEVTTGIGGTGLVGTLTRGGSGRSVGLRSELDALPIDEQSGVEYSSRNAGTMHACGHDGHMAMLLGAAARLAEQGGFDAPFVSFSNPPRSPAAAPRRCSTTACSSGSPSTACTAFTTPRAFRPATCAPARDQ
jgi:hippurate hydrolase